MKTLNLSWFVPQSIALIALVLSSQPVLSQSTYNWTPTAAGAGYNWNNVGGQNNWGSGFPTVAGDTANLNSDLVGAQIISLNQAINLGVLNIGDSTATFYPFTVQGAGGSFTLDNSGGGAQINKTGSSTAVDTIFAPITLADNLTVNVAQPLVISGAIGETNGSRTLTKATGTGVLTLSGANTYSGGTTLSAGTINFQNATALGTNTLTINNSGCFLDTASWGLSMTANNPQAWNANWTFTGTGNLNLGTGAVTLGGSGTARQVQLLNSGSLTIGGVISGAGMGLTKGGGQGGPLKLTGSNTFDGAVLVGSGGGTLIINSMPNGGIAGPLGQSTSAAANLLLGNGTTLQYIGSGDSSDRSFTINGSANGHIANLDASGAGALNLSSSTSPGLGAANQTRTLILTGSNPMTNTLAAVITDNGTAAVSVTKSSSMGTWVLSGSSTFTGPVAINNNTVATPSPILAVTAMANGGSPSPLGASSSDASNLVIGANQYINAQGLGATLKYIGSGDNSDRSFTIGGKYAGDGATLDASGTGPLHLTSAATPAYGTTNQSRTLILSGANTDDNTLSALFADNGVTATTNMLTLVKAGRGKWVLNGSSVNTYSGGTTITAGMLVGDFGNLPTPTDLIKNTTPITFGGGTLSLLAQNNVNSTQTMPNPNFSANAGSGIVLNGNGTGTMTLNLGNTWTNNTGSTINVTLGSGGQLNSTPATTNGLVVGSGNVAFATVNGTDWAKTNASGVVAFGVGDYTGFVGAGATPTVNYRLTGSATVTTAQTNNTLKIATTANGQSLTINAGVTNTLNAGGLLFVGTNDYSITGGTLLGSGGTQKELVVHQFGSGNLTIGSTIANNSSNTVLAITGPGKLTLSGANPFNGNTYAGGGGMLVLKHPAALTNSPLYLNNCSLVFDSSAGTNFTVGGLNSSYAGPGYDIALTNTAGAAIALTVNGSGTYNGVLSGSGQLIKNGSGILTLNAPNTFTGGLTINGGTVSVFTGNDWAFGPIGLVQVTVNNATLSLNRNNFNGTLILNGGTVSTGNGFGSTWTGSIVLQSTSTLNFTTGGFDIFAPISGTGGLTKSGTGGVNLRAANTFSGNTIISSGPLTIYHPLALQNSILDTTSSTTNKLALSGSGMTTLTLGGLSGSKNFSTNANTGIFTTSASGYTNLTALTLNPNASQSPSYAGAITDGATNMALIKTGAGTQTLTGPNSYTGPTIISAGTLSLGANNTLPLGTAVMLTGGVLDAQTYSNSVSTLDVTGAGVINLGPFSKLVFADSSAKSWNGGTVLVSGSFQSGSSLRFGNSNSGLTPAQLAAFVNLSSPALNTSGYLTGTVLPAIVLSGTLSALSTTSGTASAPTSFTVSGFNLTGAPGNLTVTPPAGFEVSLSSGSGYSPGLSVPYVSSTLAATTVYVRLSATAAAGSYSGNLTVSGGGAASQAIATASSTVSSGAVSPATVTMPSPGVVNLTFYGAPNTAYVVETTTNLTMPWTPLSTNLTDGNGSYAFTNSAATNQQQFYHQRLP